MHITWILVQHPPPPSSSSSSSHHYHYHYHYFHIHATLRNPDFLLTLLYIYTILASIHTYTHIHTHIYIHSYTTYPRIHIEKQTQYTSYTTYPPAARNCEIHIQTQPKRRGEDKQQLWSRHPELKIRLTVQTPIASSGVCFPCGCEWGYNQS